MVTVGHEHILAKRAQGLVVLELVFRVVLRCALALYFDDQRRIRHRVWVAFGRFWKTAHNRDIGIGCKTRSRSDAEIRVVRKTRSTAELGEEQPGYRGHQRGVLRSATCHCGDFAIEELVLDVARLFQREILSIRVLDPVMWHGHSLSIIAPVSDTGQSSLSHLPRSYLIPHRRPH